MAPFPAGVLCAIDMQELHAMLLWMCLTLNVFSVHRKDEDPEQKIEFKTRLGKFS